MESLLLLFFPGEPSEVTRNKVGFVIWYLIEIYKDKPNKDNK